MHKYFFIRSNGKYIKINFNEIIYIEGCRNYIKIVMEGKFHLVLIAMKKMEQLLPSNLFQRIHKSYIVSLDRIKEFNTDTVFLIDKTLPVGDQYKGMLEKAVTILSEESFNQLAAVPITYLTQKAFAG